MAQNTSIRGLSLVTSLPGVPAGVTIRVPDIEDDSTILAVVDNTTGTILDHTTASPVKGGFTISANTSAARLDIAFTTPR